MTVKDDKEYGIPSWLVVGGGSLATLGVAGTIVFNLQNFDPDTGAINPAVN